MAIRLTGGGSAFRSLSAAAFCAAQWRQARCTFIACRRGEQKLSQAHEGLIAMLVFFVSGEPTPLERRGDPLGPRGTAGA